jgi:hypothetical protein
MRNVPTKLVFAVMLSACADKTAPEPTSSTAAALEDEHWEKIADEGQSFTVTGTQTVRYGAVSSWVTKTMTGSALCGNSTFGDPLVGTVKLCEVLVVDTWEKIADEWQSFSVGTNEIVRFGANSSWVEKTLTGSGQCTNAFFGTDPLYGVFKSCQRKVPGAMPIPAPPTDAMAPMVMGPTIDASKIPAPNPGFDTVRIRPTTDFGVASDIGAFREICDFSHMRFDDPLVYPGQPGRSHLHTFFGNTGTNAGSTDLSITTQGNSTCAGGLANRSAYWVPALIDTRAAAPVKPNGVIVYYKTGYQVPAAIVKPLPQGLHMIAGNAKASGPQPFASWSCVHGGEDLTGSEIQHCPVGSQLWMRIIFPQCWDGANVDSADHKSHMAYAADHACPSTHPVALPEVSFNVMYDVTDANAPFAWRLSSDMYDPGAPGGYSIHGDYWFGWDLATSNTWWQNCDVASKDCHGYLLGDGRTLY